MMSHIVVGNSNFLFPMYVHRCSFEVAVSLENHLEMLYDIATQIKDDRAYIISDGLTAHDEEQGATAEGGAEGCKAAREANRP